MDNESQNPVRACEGKAICKKGWPVPTVSRLGSQSEEEKGGMSEAEEEAGAGAEGLIRQATGLGLYAETDRDSASTGTREALNTFVWEDMRAAV